MSEERCKVMLEMGVISAGAKLENGKVILPNLDKATEKTENAVEKTVEKKEETPKAKKADSKENINKK